MKNKLKLLLFGLLGLALIPNANAFTIQKINYDFPEITTVSSLDYNGQTYYYKIKGDGRQLECIEAGTVINEDNKTQFLSLPTPPAKTCLDGKVRKLLDPRYGKTFGFSHDYGIGWEGSYNRQVPAVGNSYEQRYYEDGIIKKRYFKAEILYNDLGQSSVLFSDYNAFGNIGLTSEIGQSNYSKGFQGAWGLLVFSFQDDDFDYSTLVRGKFWLHGYSFTSPMSSSEQYGSNKIYLTDTKKHIQYEFEETFLNKFEQGLLFFDFWLEDNCPVKIREYHLNAGTNTFYGNDNLGLKGYSYLPTDWRNITESECATYKSDIKARTIYNPDYLQFMAGNVSSNTGSNLTENAALVEYNACYSYYSSIKKYTSYDYNCYKSLLDSAPLTGSYDMVAQIKPWQDIQDWNGDGELSIQSNDPICLQLIEIKKEYKQQYAEKRDEFLKISSENFFYPHSMDIKGYCGERPELKDDRSFWEKTKDFFLGRTGEPRMVDDTGKKYYENDFDSDWRALRSLYWKCQGLDQFGIMKSLSLSEEDKSKACSDYQTEKAKIIKKWEHATIGDFFGGSLAAAINRIEGGGAGSGFIEKLKNDISDSVIGDSFSYVGENIFGRIKAPFYSGYNSVLGLSCASSSIPHIEIMDYIAMGLFALLAFLIFKIL